MGAGNLMCLWQKYILIHLMVQLYLGAQGLGPKSSPMEQYALNDCVGLGWKYSSRNAQNYQAFVASEYLHVKFGLSHLVMLLFVMVHDADDCWL